jgi:hemerythrin-like metal-binding protein
MKYLEWDDQYSVGVDSVDYEHQNLMDMINTIYAELGDRRDIAEIEKSVGDIHAEICAHFALEERLMREAEYEEYYAHKNDHEELLDQIRYMMDVISVDPEKALDLLSDQLADWFNGHFATFDARLHSKLGH